MLTFYLSASDGGDIVNKVAFYTPTDLNYSVGDEVEILFTADLSLSQSSADFQVSASLQHYLVFDISGSDLPQVGGFYTIKLVDSYIWGQTEPLWGEADFAWGANDQVEYDSERGFIVELIATDSYTGSFETSSYTTHSFEYTPTYYTSSFETSSYYTGSFPISGASAYISVREEGTYYIYNG